MSPHSCCGVRARVSKSQAANVPRSSRPCRLSGSHRRPNASNTAYEKAVQAGSDHQMGIRPNRHGSCPVAREGAFGVCARSAPFASDCVGFSGLPRLSVCLLACSVCFWGLSGLGVLVFVSVWFSLLVCLLICFWVSLLLWPPFWSGVTTASAVADAFRFFFSVFFSETREGFVLLLLLVLLSILGLLWIYPLCPQFAEKASAPRRRFSPPTRAVSPAPS
jgi:hypothetical protein